MAQIPPVSFSFQFGPVGTSGMSDAQLYAEAMADAVLGHKLGYKVGWMIEHHFSEYYPTPNPLLFLANVASKCPGLGLGTSVMVLPWYNPIRFAEDLAMLQTLAGSELHVGLGRGTAIAEYKAFEIDMASSRERFAEHWDVVDRFLSGDHVTYSGKFTNIPDPIELRPRLNGKMPNFYGAIGSQDSASVVGSLGLPPMAIAQFPDKILRDILATWREKAQASGFSTDRKLPIFTQCWIADSDEEARALAKRYLPRFFEIQVEHYQSDADPLRWVTGYEQWSKLFGNLKRLCNPDNLDDYLALNLVGTPDRIERRIRELADIGFNDIIVTNAIYGVSRELRHGMLNRFAAEIMPRFGADARIPASALG